MSKQAVLYLASSVQDAKALTAFSMRDWDLTVVYNTEAFIRVGTSRKFSFFLYDFTTPSLFPKEVVKQLRPCNTPIFLFSRSQINIHHLFPENGIVVAQLMIPYRYPEIRAEIKKKLDELTHHQTATPLIAQQLRGSSVEIQAVHQQILQVSKSNAPVLIVAETGTGKEVVANLIHQFSPRSNHAFVPLNGGGVHADLAESLLFGTIKGIYTGAENRKGFFQEAHKGTLFLDEIDSLSLAVQEKLLRVLEYKSFYPLGSQKLVYSDFRLICASNKDLRQLCHEGIFRSDLYYRIDVLRVSLPSLRNRIEDIPELIEERLDQAGKVLLPCALQKLQNHEWKGNVRELYNCLDRAIHLTHDKSVISQSEIIF